MQVLNCALQVIKEALARARLFPRALENLEMHGTGTPLGDPIEVGAAVAVLGPAEGRPFSLSAVKSMLGHSEPSAGAASVWHMVKRQVLFELKDSHTSHVFVQEVQSLEEEQKLGGKRETRVW